MTKGFIDFRVLCKLFIWLVMRKTKRCKREQKNHRQTDNNRYQWLDIERAEKKGNLRSEQAHRISDDESKVKRDLP